MYSNCLYYAIYKLLLEGGTIQISKSSLVNRFNVGKYHIFNFIPHFTHVSTSGTRSSFVPTEEQKQIDYIRGATKTLLVRCFTLWMFKGKVVYD